MLISKRVFFGQEGVLWYMLFANDIMSVDKLRYFLNVKLERWQDALESTGFKISCTKMEYMNCNFNGNVQRYATPV